MQFALILASDTLIYLSAADICNCKQKINCVASKKNFVCGAVDLNRVIRTIGKRLKELAAFIERLKEELQCQAEPTVNNLLVAYRDERNATAWGQVFKNRNLYEY